MLGGQTQSHIGVYTCCILIAMPTKRLRPKEKQRRANVRKFQNEKKNNAVAKFNGNIVRAESMLVEVKELAKELRPFLQNGAILLGRRWDDLISEQINVAITGTQKRLVLGDDGKPVRDEKGNDVYTSIPVDGKEQIKTRQSLIEMFPRLIPEEARNPEHDPLAGLAHVLQNGGGGELVVAAKVNEKNYQPDENMVEGVGSLISDNSSKDSIIDTDSQNA